MSENLHVNTIETLLPAILQATAIGKILVAKGLLGKDEIIEELYSYRKSSNSNEYNSCVKTAIRTVEGW